MVALEQGAWLAKKNLQIGTGAALTLSALGVPAAWPFVPSLYIHQYNPQVFWDGGLAWRKVIDDVRGVRRQIESIVDGVCEDGWKSADGRAFRERVDRFLDDLLGIEIRAGVVAMTLFMAAVLTMAAILFMALIAALLALVAAWVLIATVTPLSAATARLTATMTLANTHATLKSTEAMLNTALHTCAGVIGALVAGDVLVEAARGDLSGVQDFIDGTIAQGPMLIWGSANRLERDATAFGLAGKFPSGGLHGRLAGSNAGAPLPAGLPQAAGAKGFYETQYNGGNQALTGGLTPGQNPDGSYDYPWE